MEAKLGLDYGSVFSVLSGLVEVGLVVLNADRELDFANERARSLLGCGSVLDLEECFPEVRTALMDAADAVDAGTGRTRRIRIESDGSSRAITLEAHPIEEDACTGYLVLVKDVENMRRMATDLGLAAQFRNTRRLYRAVVQNLKQPISAVMLHADLVRERLAPDDESEEPSVEVRYLGIIKRQIRELDRALTLLAEEIEPAATEERGFSLCEVIADVQKLVEPLAAGQNVEVEVTLPDHAARMNGYRQKVKQAFLNLAVNALDAMPGGGTLHVAVHVANDEAEVSISDTGVGIEPDVVPHIFEMHFTTKDTGTGVGLYVARDVIEKHDGRLTVQSEPNKGSTFRVILPVSKNGS